MADTKYSALSDGTAPAGADVFSIARSGGNNKLTWTELLAAMPGAEIGYDEITAAVPVTTATTPGTTVITCAAHTFSGAAVIVEFYAPRVTPGSNDYIFINLVETGTALFAFGGSTISVASTPFFGRRKFTPSVGSHTYVVTAVRNAVNGSIEANDGSPGNEVPAYVRFTVA